ncbi:F-box/kelch-repeat protein At3g06240-like [Punica granatum]|uniref:F-box domain-containing protein n=2 Tax=Punica granatum TaxID=22663 RepID=A0A218W406_PUNGR|nr:F-box/kelch-repeat protein At3g06240-like [Punica granatum]OWM67594.1 hypothetical protein CDL15_Pgr024679 [Punica granatum]PKI37030.1 hypothetical protein CRG98_042563 [Punica granatum]
MEMVREEGILIDILSRLPVKSLLRFKCVCKQWRSFISDPDFAKSQLRRSMEQNPSSCRRLLWLNNPIRSIDCENLSCSSAGTAIRVIKPPSIISDPRSFKQVGGSCNGLLCLVANFECFILWNPTTGAYNELPSPSPCPDTAGRQFFYGFGYDCSTDDYKLLKGSTPSYGSQSVDTIAEIYSCRTNTWRRMKYDRVPYVTGRGLFLNGSLHWLVETDLTDNDGMIVSFDVTNEKFGGLVSPLSHDRGVLFKGLMIAEDCLFVYQGLKTGINGFTLEGWVLSDYRMKSSWTNICSFLIEECRPLRYFWHPVWFRKDGKVLFHLGQEDTTVLIYDPDKGTGDGIKIAKLFLYNYRDYVESLISPFPN